MISDPLEKFTLRAHHTLVEYVVVAIKSTIKEGNYPPGSQIPTEKELVTKLQVSRTTIREAMRMLEEEGLIIRKQGLGTFVSERAILKDLTQNTGITEMFKQSGRTSRTEQASVEHTKASGKISEALSIAIEDPILLIDRVRAVDNTPMVWTLDYVPAQIVGIDGLNNFDPMDNSIYDFFKNELNISIVRGVVSLCSIEASHEISEKLNVSVGTPIMELSQKDYDSNDRIVLYSIEYHIPDSFQFLVYRKGPHWF